MPRSSVLGVHVLCLYITINGKLSGFSETASTFILDIKVLKLNIGLARLQTMVEIGKSLQVSFNLDVTFMLLNTTEGLINQTALLKNSMWQMFSGGFLDIFEGIRECNLDLLYSGTGKYHCMYFKQDGKRVIHH